MAFDPEQYIDQAYQWLCRKRKHYHFNNEVWHLRFHWERERPLLIRQMQEGSYTFDWVRKVTTPQRTSFLWQAADVLVLKTLALYLEERLRPVLGDCIYHLAGTAGAKRGQKAAVREVCDAVPRYRFVLRTDVQGYYAAIRHDLLTDRLARYIDEPNVLRLCRRFLRHTVSDDGRLYDLRQGISLGCPLSPLLGALFLKPLDDALQQMDVFYLRFMDDWVVMARSRWKLRRAIAVMNQCLEQLRLEKHPGKTSMGRTRRGFDFLGYHFRPAGDGLVTAEKPPSTDRAGEGSCCAAGAEPDGKVLAGSDGSLRKEPQVRLAPAQKTILNYLKNYARLYEQGADEDRAGQYSNRWRRWCRAGLEGYVEPVMAHALPCTIIVDSYSSIA